MLPSSVKRLQATANTITLHFALIPIRIGRSKLFNFIVVYEIASFVIKMGKKYILVLFFLVFQQVMAQEKRLNLYLNSNSEVVSLLICYIDSICVTTASTLDNTIVFSGLPIINLKVEEKIENPVSGCLTVEKEINTIGGVFCGKLLDI